MKRFEWYARVPGHEDEFGPYDTKKDARQVLLRTLDRNVAVPRGTVFEKRPVANGSSARSYDPPFRALTAADRWPGFGDSSTWMVLDSNDRFVGHADDEDHANARADALNRGKKMPPSRLRVSPA